MANILEKSLLLHSSCKFICSRILLRNFARTPACTAWRDRSTELSDPGIKRRARIFKDDENQLAEMQDEEDFAKFESDFADADLSFKEHKRLVHKKKDQMMNMMTIKKFFKPPKSPSMLTWAERIQIKQLHEKDPEEWSVDVLAESFPASREIVQKIIDSTWTPKNKEKAEKMDEFVRKNWELLAEDKLEAEPKYLEHLKKFIHRREEYLSAMGTADVENMFKKEEPKKIWNNGQMAGVLASYEKSLDMIDHKAKLKLQADALASGNGLLEAPAKSNREVIEERVKFEKEINKRAAESFKIGGEVELDKTPVTLNELKRNLSQQGSADPLGKAILEASGPVSGGEVVKERKSINERLANLAGYTLNRVSDTLKPEKLQEEEKSSSRKQDIPTTSGILAGQSQEENTEPYTNPKVSVNESSVDADRPYSIGSEGLSSSIENERRKENHTPLRSEFEEKKTPLNFSTEREKEELQIEESSIDGTFFWPSEGTPLEPTVEINQNETNDKPGKVISSSSAEEIAKTLGEYRNASGKAAKEEVTEFGKYPQKIKIPNDKVGKGLTYKVNDCFYDEHGDFLYRVPGMTTSS